MLPVPEFKWPNGKHSQRGRCQLTALKRYHSPRFGHTTILIRSSENCHLLDPPCLAFFLRFSNKHTGQTYTCLLPQLIRRRSRCISLRLPLHIKPQALPFERSRILLQVILTSPIAFQYALLHPSPLRRACPELLCPCLSSSQR